MSDSKVNQAHPVDIAFGLLEAILSTDKIELMTVAFEAMGSGETIQRALARVDERAPERDIISGKDLIRTLYEIGEGGIASEISQRIAELQQGESEDAIAGLWALAKASPYDAWLAAGLAINRAQERCGDHPRPRELAAGLDLNEQGFHFGTAWQFWGTQAPEAIEAARREFASSLPNLAFLGRWGEEA
jgi:hypothetical protein